MARQHNLLLILGLLLLVTLTVTRAADGEVPTATDSAACNEEAPATTRAGMATPIRADHARAERARAAAMTTDSLARGGRVIESPDPQIHGMDAEGAKNSAYQAAYRGCMRRKGF